MIERVFFDIGAGLAFLALWANFSRYKKLNKGQLWLGSSTECYEFVQHSLMSIWLMFGFFLVAFFRIRAWWIIAWFPLGGAAMFAMDRLVAVSGLSYFIEIGQNEMNEMAKRARND